MPIYGHDAYMDMMHIPGLCDFTGTRDLATPIRGLGVSPWFTAHKVPPAHRLAGSTKAVSPALSLQAESIHHHGQKQMLPQPEPEQTPPPETKISQQEEAMLPEAEER